MLAPWATFAVAGAPLWLSLLGLSSAGVVPPPPPQEQLAPLLRRTLPTSWVYRGDSRHPNTVRAAGGFRPQGDSYWTQDRAFNFTAHQEGNPADFPDNFSEDSDDESIAPYVTAFVSTSHNISVAVDFAENHGWIYQIHATPNMFIPAQMNDDFEDEDEIPALGGIPWSAVYAYAQMTEDCVDVVLTDDYEANQNCWTLNGDYNEGWNNFAMSPAPPEPATEGNLRQAAINFLDGVGAPLGWEGQFPLPLTFADMLENAGVDQASVVELESQMFLVDRSPPFGITAQLACAQFLATILVNYPQSGSGMNGRRHLAIRDESDVVVSLEPPESLEIEPPSNCTKLQTKLSEIKGLPVEASPRVSVCSGGSASGLTKNPRGRPLAELLSVHIVNIDRENPGDLYGDITVTDEVGTQDVYRRNKHEHQSIRPGQDVVLTGPARAISAANGFYANVSLIDHDGGFSPNDEVGKGQVRWKAHDADTLTRCEEIQSQHIHGKYGSARVNFIVMDDAAEATIEVILINGDNEKEVEVYGRIKAWTRLIGPRDLFNKGEAEFVKVRPNHAIGLTRPVMAVPMDFPLYVQASLMDDDTVADDDIGEGTFEFPPHVNRSASKRIRSEKGEIEVRVTWR